MTPWKKSLAALCLMEFLAMMGISEFMPFLPLYVQKLGVADPRDAAAASGMLFGAGFLAAAVMSPFWGHMADRFGRRRMAIRAMLGSGLALAGMGWARSVTDLAVLRVLQGALGGFVSSATALGVSFSLAMLGNAVGPFIGGAVAHDFGLQAPFLARPACWPWLGSTRGGRCAPSAAAPIAPWPG